MKNSKTIKHYPDGDKEIPFKTSSNRKQKNKKVSEHANEDEKK